MSMNVQAYGAPARLTPRDYEIVGRSVTPPAPAEPAPTTLDQYTPSDHKAAANPYANVVDSLRVAALRRDAAAPGVGARRQVPATAAFMSLSTSPALSPRE